MAHIEPWPQPCWVNPAPDASPSPVTTGGDYRTVHIYPGYWPPLETASRPSRSVPSIQEQLGTDPISKLADAIKELAVALRETRAD
jgi:hypothetical protein